MRTLAMMTLTMLLALVSSATAEAGPGAGGPPAITTCTARAWNAGDCSLVVVTPVRFGAIGSWVQYPLEIPQRGGERIEPFERGTTGNGQYTARFDTRDFAWEMNALCPQVTCEVSFMYGSGSSSSILEIRVSRGADRGMNYLVSTFDPNAAEPTWVQTPAYAVSWNDSTLAARRMMHVIDASGNGISWITPNARGALFSSQQPGWQMSF